MLLWRATIGEIPAYALESGARRKRRRKAGFSVRDLLGLRDDMHHSSWLLHAFWPCEGSFVHRGQGSDATERSHLQVHAADAALRQVDMMCPLRQAAQQIIADGGLDTSSAPSCPGSASTPHFQQRPVTGQLIQIVLYTLTFLRVSVSSFLQFTYWHAPFCVATAYSNFHAPCVAVFFRWSFATRGSLAPYLVGPAFLIGRNLESLRSRPRG